VLDKSEKKKTKEKNVLICFPTNLHRGRK
jgi:hypothetical protein